MNLSQVSMQMRKKHYDLKNESILIWVTQDSAIVIVSPSVTVFAKKILYSQKTPQYRVSCSLNATPSKVAQTDRLKGM